VSSTPSKKLIQIYEQNIVASLCKKFQKAKNSIETVDSAVEELTNAIGNNSWISEWKKSEKNARIQRGEALMIYNVAQPPGMFWDLVSL